jgi:hypothetical protein
MDTPGTEGWTPREYVALLFLIARNASIVEDADAIMADLRATIARLERGSEAIRR